MRLGNLMVMTREVLSCRADSALKKVSEPD